MRHLFLRVLLFSLALAGMMGAGVQAEQLLNPGFETGDLSNWATFGDGWRIGGAGDAQSGSWGVVDDIATNDGGEWHGIHQEVAATEGQIFAASVWIKTIVVESSQSWLEVQFKNGNSILSQFQSPHLTTNNWAFEKFSIDNITAPAGTTAVDVRGIVFKPSGSSQEDVDFHVFDNFSLTLVPEPTSMAMTLTAVIGLVAYAWRRRK